MTVNKTTRNTDGSLTSIDAQVEATAFKVAQSFGVRTDTTLRIVDEYGSEATLRALEYTQNAVKGGQSFASPMAFMTSLLRKGIIQAEMVAESAEPDPGVDFLHQRYHNQQANSIDTAAKRLARASGLTSVKCACGEEFAV